MVTFTLPEARRVLARQRSSSAISCSTSCPRASRRSATTASSPPVNGIVSSKSATSSEPLALPSQPLLLRLRLNRLCPVSCVPLVAGLCTVPKPYCPNIVAPLNRSNMARLNSPTRADRQLCQTANRPVWPVVSNDCKLATPAFFHRSLPDSRRMNPLLCWAAVFFLLFLEVSFTQHNLIFKVSR